MSTTANKAEQPFGKDAQDVTKLAEFPPMMLGRVFTMSADIESLDKQLKVARFRNFEIYCDEPHWIGGEDEYAQPLTYLAASVGF